MPNITFSERELEDYFCSVADEELECRVIGRQLRLDCGVADVLLRSKNSGDYYVVELKKDQLTNESLAQVCAYTVEFQARHPLRRFIPVLCGASITDKYLCDCLDQFFPDHRPTIASVIIFGWSLCDGVSLNWYNTSQREKEENREQLSTQAFAKRRAASCSNGGKR